MYLTFLTNKNKTLTQNDISIDDLFDNTFEVSQDIIPEKTPYITKTVITSHAPNSYNKKELQKIKQKLIDIANRHNPETINQEYSTFYIPKRSGGLREINAPTEELMKDLKEMQQIFQYELKVLYHNAAYAYVPRRSIKTALEKHQYFKSKWFLKLDIKNFFPSCSQKFVVKMLKKIYPFSQFTTKEINSFIWVCFRNDELPQGTPMSPMLTNLIMIPIDYAITQYAQTQHFVYTRYADDILISAYEKWDFHITEQAINKIFTMLQTPFQLKTEKTRYGSSAGRNWNLGLMLNKNNNITIGYRNKKNYRAMLNNLMTAESSGEHWSKDELYHFQGLTSYYLSIEPEYFRQLIKKYEELYNIKLKEIYKRI